MSSSPSDDGFFSRWSRRKAQVRQGQPVHEPPPPPPPTPKAVVGTAPAPAAEPATPDLPAIAVPEAPPPPTLAEAAALTPADDFSRFVARDVASAVKNTALKQLFSDPHFNVMDGLDTYIDDYSLPDPLPSGMLEQLAQADALGLISRPDGDARADALPATVPLSPPPAAQAGEAPTPDDPAHEDPDLRLQPHDAAGRPGPEPSPGRDAGGPP